ncbi:beta-propeller domain-containing protein [Candidatus Woesearchaeota archaeon]|nr:beta-propeller domain-containing protein [Candidatus Woesearchaeota archaeon]
MKTRKQNIAISMMVLALLIVTACKELTTQTQNIPQSQVHSGTYETFELSFSDKIKTKQFTSEKELNDFINQNSGGSYYYGGLARGMTNMMVEDMVMAESAAMAMEESTDTGVAVQKSVGGEDDWDYSETNVQVEGVDEADIIKTDGNYIYTVSEKTLFIIRAYPGEDAEIVSTIKLDQRPSGIFINEDYLAVFGDFYDNDFFKEIDFTPRYGMTFFNIYDIEDRENPELLKEYKFEGNYFRSRMAGDYIYLVTSTRPYYRPIPMPVILDGTTRSTVAVEDIYYFDIPYQNPVFVNIHAIDFDDLDEDISSKSIAVESSQNMYMSHDNIYITYTEYVNEYEIQQQIIMELLDPYVTESDKLLIEKIKKTDNEILSKAEKDAKIFRIYESYASTLSSDELEEVEEKAEEMLRERLEEYNHFEFTVINRINVDKDKIKPEANGKVPGHIINQFSMDENDNIFRIATTLNPRWSRFEKQRTESTNNVYTLNMDLEILDELEGLAENEQIYSTRFIGERLYMVTFKQIDPFFVIDLSDPENIEELGKLKIPGFSRYLHPYDKDTIIGIGQDATESGRTQGLKISLFDVSDVENPKEIAKYVSDSRYTQSTAMYEHKAFLFSKEKNLLVIPAYNYDYNDPSENYNGAFVFEITKDSIKLRGLIDHSQGEQKRWYQPSVERSLYIEEQLYTKSLGLLRINRIEDLGKVKNIELKYTNPNIKVY